MTDLIAGLDQVKREAVSDLLTALHAACREAALVKSALTAKSRLRVGIHLSVWSTPLRVALNLAAQALDATDNKTGYIPLPYRAAKVDKPIPIAKGGRILPEHPWPPPPPPGTLTPVVHKVRPEHPWPPPPPLVDKVDKVVPAPPSPPSPTSSTVLPLPGVGSVVVPGKRGRPGKGKVDEAATEPKVPPCDFPERSARRTCRRHCPEFHLETGSCCPFVAGGSALFTCDGKHRRECLGEEAAKDAK